MTVTRAWEDLERWLSAEAPSILEGLRPGASDELLFRAEAVFGMPFPESISELYRRHDGQEPGAPGLFDASEFLSLEKMLTIREERLEFFQAHPTWSIEEKGPVAEPGIREVWWDPSWLPLTCNGSGDYMCVDLAPGPGGNRGQMIRVWGNDPAREMREGSLSQWFCGKVQGIVRGDYILSPDHDGLMRLEDL